MKLTIDATIKENHSFKLLCALQEYGFSILREEKVTKKIDVVKDYKKSKFMDENVLSLDEAHFYTCHLEVIGTREDIFVSLQSFEQIFPKMIESKAMIDFGMDIKNR